MILGTGSDLIDIRRLEKTLERYGARFENRIFTEKEQAKAKRRVGGGQRNNHVSTYAKRFAAKEACSKALGTGLRQGVFWRDMEVINLPSGKPTLQLTNGAKAALERLVPKGHAAQVDLTMTDEYPLAQAYVIISAYPRHSGA